MSMKIVAWLTGAGTPRARVDMEDRWRDIDSVRSATALVTMDDAHARIDAALAEERERWAGPVRALLAAHDAALLLVGEQMRSQGVTSLRISAVAEAELAAIETLRRLEAR